MPSYDLRSLSAKDLVTKLASLVASDHQLTADMLAHIAEVDTRSLYLESACSSMFTYCVSRLHMSESSAYKRIEVARAARRYPAIFGHVASGDLSLSAVRLLAPRLTAENHHSLLEAARKLSRRGIEELIANRFPQPDIEPSLRKLPERRPPVPPDTSAAPVPSTPAATTQPLEQPGETMPPSPPDQVPRSFVSPMLTARAELKPLSAARYLLKLTLSKDTRDKLLKAQALMRHRVPGGELDAVLDRALDALLRELRHGKYGETDRPQKKPRPLKDGSRTVPNTVKREVAARDDDRCTFVDAQGHRCEERAFLEFDHIRPVARGGMATSAEDVRLRCRSHNLHAAQQAFGKEFMNRKIADARRRRAERKLAPGRAPSTKAREHSRPAKSKRPAGGSPPIKAGEHSRAGKPRTGRLAKP